MNGQHKAKRLPPRWTSRVLYDGRMAVIEHGYKSLATLTGNDASDCGCYALETEEFVVPKGFAQRLCDLLNELEWYPDA